MPGQGNATGEHSPTVQVVTTATYAQATDALDTDVAGSTGAPAAEVGSGLPRADSPAGMLRADDTSGMPRSDDTSGMPRADGTAAAPEHLLPTVDQADPALVYPGIHEAAAAAAASIARAGGRRATVRVVSVATMPAERARAAMPLVVAGSEGRALCFSHDMLIPITEAVMGLPATPAHAPRVTATQAATVVSHLGPAFGPVAEVVLPAAPPLRLRPATGEPVWEALGEELVIVHLKVTVDGVPGSVALVGPSSEGASGAVNETARTALWPVPVAVSAQLPPVRVPARAFVGLRPGSELPLGVRADASWVLHAPGRAIAVGRLGQADGRMSVSVDQLWNEDEMDMTTNAPHDAIIPADGDGLDPLSVIGDVLIDVTVQAGSTTMPVSQLAALAPGQVIRLESSPSAPAIVLANGRKVATAHILVQDGLSVLRIVSVG